MYNKFLPDTFVKSFKLRDNRTIEMGLRLVKGCEILVVDLTIDDVHPLVDSKGVVKESLNGLIKYGLNTDNIELKNIVLVYEGGWYIDLMESYQFVESNFQSSDYTMEWVNGYDRKEPSFIF